MWPLVPYISLYLSRVLLFAVPACDIRGHGGLTGFSSGHVSVDFPKLVVAKWSRNFAEFGDHLANPHFAATWKVEYRAALSFFKKFEF